MREPALQEGEVLRGMYKNTLWEQARDSVGTRERTCITGRCGTQGDVQESTVGTSKRMLWVHVREPALQKGEVLRGMYKSTL